LIPLRLSRKGSSVTRGVSWRSYLLHRAGEIIVRLDQARHDEE
jgi:hypothetical protein